MGNFKPKNYHGFDHTEVAKQFGGDLTFKNSFALNQNDNVVVSVYHAANPDRSKGHKDYMLLYQQNGTYYVAGMTAEQMEKERYLDNAAECLDCHDIIYSTYRHDYALCSCGQISTDGGKAYNKMSFGHLAQFKPVKIDLLECKVLEDESKPNRKEVL
jgi:hypothetical protein